MNYSFLWITHFMAYHGYKVTVLEFEGQNNRTGMFSVRNSCFALSEYIARLASTTSIPIFVFGICSGAVASLYAAVQNSAIKGVFCWELSPFYKYTRPTVTVLAYKFGIHIDWETILEAVQPIDLIPNIAQNILFGLSTKSNSTTLAEQNSLAHLAPKGKSLSLGGVNHFIGESPGSAEIIANSLKLWMRECVVQEIRNAY